MLGDEVRHRGGGDPRPADGDVPEGLLGEVIVLDDVGPIRRERAHPVARAVVGPLLIAAALLVGLLVLVPVVRVVFDAVVAEGGFFRGSPPTGTVWSLDDLGAIWFRTLIWAVVVPSLVMAVGMLLAFRLGRRPGWLLGAALLAPAAVPLVVTGVAFRLLYHPDPDRGFATYLLGFIPGDAGWLGPQPWITISLILAFMWVWLGLAALVFRAALDRVPLTLADVARAAGHRRWGSTAAAVFHDAYWQPVLRRVFGMMYVLVAVMSVRTLDLILVATPGSVLDDARVLSVMHYQQSLSAPAGTSAALGTLWLLAIAAVLGVAVWTWPAWPMPSADEDAGGDAARGRDTVRADGDGAGRTAAGHGVAAAPAAPSASAASQVAVRRDRPRRTVLRLLVVGVWLVPLVVLVTTALHPPRLAAVGGWWSRPLGLGSFGRLGSVGFFDSLRLTALVTVIVCVTAVVVAGLAVEAFERLSARAARVAFVVAVAAAVVPVQVIADPINDVFDGVESATPLGLPGELRLTLVHVALAVPLCVVVLMAARAQAYGRAKLAWQDTPVPTTGAWRTLRRSIAATRRFLGALDQEPAVIAAVVLVFLQVWNDFVVGLFFAGPDAATPVGLLLYGQTRQFVANSGPLAAGAVAFLAVPMALLVALREPLIDGLVGMPSAPDQPEEKRW